MSAKGDRNYTGPGLLAVSNVESSLCIAAWVMLGVSIVADGSSIDGVFLHHHYGKQAQRSSLGLVHIWESVTTARRVIIRCLVCQFLWTCAKKRLGLNSTLSVGFESNCLLENPTNSAYIMDSAF